MEPTPMSGTPVTVLPVSFPIMTISIKDDTVAEN